MYIHINLFMYIMLISYTSNYIISTNDFIPSTEFFFVKTHLNLFFPT